LLLRGLSLRRVLASLLVRDERNDVFDSVLREAAQHPLPDICASRPRRWTHRPRSWPFW
jgi:hypothetical protein